MDGTVGNTVSVRVGVEYFETNDPPLPHQGWNLPAFQAYCQEELCDSGFDLLRPIHCYYNRAKREILFWQELEKIEVSEDLWN